MAEPNTLAVTVDAPAEAERLRTARAEGKPPTAGDTPVVERRQSGSARCRTGVLMAIDPSFGPGLGLALALTSVDGKQRGGGVQSGDLHAGQRHAGGGGDQPPGTGGQPSCLVQGRLCRQSAWQVRPRPFSRASDVQGHRDLAPGEFSRIVARNGGNENAFTGQDYTGYFQTIAKDRLETVMRMEADRMTNLRLARGGADRAQTSSSRSARCGSTTTPDRGWASWSRHPVLPPLSLPVIGWRQEMASFSREDALAFYRTWYAPDNAILIVAGDIDAAELRPLAEKYYGAIPARSVPAALRLKEPPQDAPREVDLADPGFSSPPGSAPISRRASAPARSSTPIRSRCWARSWAAPAPRGSIARW